jgi:hypothetical protein
MEKSLTLIVGGLLFALVANAQDVPKFETFLGFTYKRTDLQSDNALGKSIGSFSMNGGSAQFIYNFNKPISFVADLGAVNRGNVGVVKVNRQDSFPYLDRVYHITRRHASLPIFKFCSVRRSGRPASK